MNLNPSALIPLAAFLGFLVLIALVARQDLRKRVNQLFIWYAFTMAVWALSSFMVHANFPVMSTFFWNNLLIVAMVFGSIAYFHFVQVFLRRSESILWLSLGYGIAVLFIVPVVLGYALESAYFSGGVYYHELGIATYIIAPIGYSFVLAAIYQMIREFRHTKDPFVRNKLIYPLAGITVALLLVLTNFMGELGRYPIDQTGNLINACLLAYAILRYRVIDVGIALRRGFLYSVLTALIICIFLVVALPLQAALHAQAGQVFWVSAVIMALILAAVFLPLYRFLQRWIDRLFYREAYEYRHTLLASSQKMSTVLDVDELARWVVDNLTVTMGAAKAGLFLLDKETQQYIPRPLKGYDNSAVSQIRFRGDNPVVTRLAEGNSCLTAEDIDRLPHLRSLWKSERGQLRQLETEVLVPLKAKDELIGMVVLGPKRSEEVYSSDDLELLLTVASQAAVAVENARLYEESQIRAEKLRESEEKYRMLVEDMGEGYVVVTGEKIAFANRRCAEVMGKPVEEIAGQSFWKFLPPDMVERARKVYERAMAGERAPEIQEFTVIRDDGSRLPLEVRFKEITYGGRPSYSLVMRDITERKKAEEERERRTREMADLRDIATVVSQTLDLDELLDNALTKVLELMGVEAGGIFHLDPAGRRFTLRTHRGISEEMVGDIGLIELTDEELERALWWREPTVDLARVFGDEGVARLVGAVEREGLQMLTIVPVRAKGERYGALCIASHQPREVSPEDVDLLNSIANQIAVGIENARLYQETKETAERLAVTGEVTRLVGSSLDIREVYQSFTSEIKKLIDFDRASITLVDGDRVRFFSVASDEETELGGGATLPLKDSVTAWVVENRRTNIETDFAQERQFTIDETHLKSGLRSAIRVPLLSKGEVFGSFNLTSRRPNAYGEREREILEQVAGQIAVAIENSSLFTAVKAHEKELEKAYEELKAAHDYMVQAERLRALGEMASGVAHDFNNVLAVILGRAQLALEDVRDPKLKKSLHIIEQTAVDGAKTVRRLQDMSRVRVDREFETVNVNEVVKSALQMVEPRRAERQVTAGVEIDISADLDKVPAVEGTPAELREALMNIIFNAMDAMPEGGKIVVRSEQEDSWVVLSIADSGVGIPEDVRGKIFDPFFTTKGPEGLGLGLSVTYGIVTRHGGSIEVDSTVGKGSTFYIRLPIAGGARKRTRANSTTHHIRRANILLLDDDPEVGEVLRLTLSQLGHQVTLAASGEQGLGIFGQGDYDLVITDLGMADMSGRDVAQAVKEARPAVPVILITGWGVQLDPDGMRKIGIDGVIAKPFSKEDLSLQLAELLPAEPGKEG